MSYDQTAEDEQQDPATLPAECVQRRAGGHVRRSLPEPDDECQQRDVERTEDRRDPRRRPSCGSVLRERRRPRRARCRPRRGAGRSPRAPAGTRRRGPRPARARCRARRTAGSRRPCRRRNTSTRGDRRDDCDRGGENGATEGQDDQQDRDEDGRTDRSLTHRRLTRAGQRPNRRCRRANSRSAASNASGPKSGHSASQV